MKYKGKYKTFDLSKIKTYPLKTRTNKVKFSDLIFPENLSKKKFELAPETLEKAKTLAQAVVNSRKENKPVILFTGAHLIKNGLSPLLVDLIKNGIFTLVAGNGATAIHDFELALIGETSEHVPNALGKGQFGMAYEFALINTALQKGNQEKLGYGEVLGKTICEQEFQNTILNSIIKEDLQNNFSNPEVSVLAACYQENIPFTVHAGIGVDVIDQHPSFDGEAKGGCSGRDFLIFANETTKLVNGGVFLNIGSAIQGPEVLLKSVSMAANIGKTPQNIITADIDFRPYNPKNMTDESSTEYYFRDQKSIVTRVPEAFNGKGIYLQGDQRQIIPVLYQEIKKELSKE
jgi:hypothetical protein